MKIKSTKKPKKLAKILRKLTLAILVVILIVIIALLLATSVPTQYQPATPQNNKQVSPYLTHQLAPDVFNKIQLDKPFELIVSQDGINDIIARGQWPQTHGSTTFSAPAMIFEPDRILVMATIDLAKYSLVITVILHPAIDDTGLLALNIKNIKAGKLDITPFGKQLTSMIITDQLKSVTADQQQFLQGLSDAIIQNKPFDPTFEIYEKNLKITKLEITNQKATLTFTPQKTP